MVFCVKIGGTPDIIRKEFQKPVKIGNIKIGDSLRLLIFLMRLSRSTRNDKKAVQAISIHVIAGSEWKINGCPGYHANVSLRGAQRRGNLLQKIVFFPLTFLTKDKYINVDEE
jgi:hypothetical protein